MLPSDHTNISRQKTCQLMSAAASLQAARSNSQDKVYTSYSIVICKKKKDTRKDQECKLPQQVVFCGHAHNSLLEFDHISSKRSYT